MHHSSDKGFTLIELMVAITILAIISVVGYTSYISLQQRARDSTRVADIQEIQKALEQYYQINRGYPAVSDGNGTKSVNMMTSEISSYFSQNIPPSDPNPGAFSPSYEYTYYSCGGHITSPESPATNYVVCAKLESNSNGVNADLPSDGCTDPTSSDPHYYCLSGQSQ